MSASPPSQDGPVPSRPYTADEVLLIVQAQGLPSIATQDGRLVAVNEAFCRATGYPVEELGRRPFEKLVSPEEHRRLTANEVELRRGGRYERRTYPVVGQAKGGRLLQWQLTTWFLPAEADGDPYSLTCVLEPSQAEAEVCASELLVALASEIFLERTEDGIRRRVVGRLEAEGIPAAFWRSRRERWVGLGPGGQGPPLLEAPARQALGCGEPILQGTGLHPTTVYLPVQAPSGGPELLLLSGAFSASHRFALMLFSRALAAAFDACRLIGSLERRTNQAELLLELARTAASTLELQVVLEEASDFVVPLLEVSNCFIMLHDPEHRVLRGAAASRNHRQFFRNVVLHLDQPSAACLAARERRIVAIEDVSADGAVYARELVERFGELALLAVPLLVREELVGVMVLDDTRGPRPFPPATLRLAEAMAGQLALSIANAQLYESLKESYAELERTRAEMVKRERLAALGELSAVVAHEVRNPLGVIFNAVSALRRLAPARGDGPLLLDIVAEESDRLNRLVGELLDFARPRELARQEEDLSRVIREAVEAAEASPGLQGAPPRIRIEIPEGLLPLPMDRRMLRQALLNLLLNAAQASPPGGSIRVSAAQEGGAEGAWVVVVIEDEGPGVAPELLPRIFEPFFTTRAQGSGLGLAVVKRIVEDHEGTIDVRSSGGQGTAFTLRLPARGVSEAP